MESQFGYFTLTWMFYSRKGNSKINRIHERSLRIVYKHNIYSFQELLTKDKSFCIHHRNIQSLTIELFKVKNNLSKRIMCDIFETRNLDYSLRSQIDFIRTRVNISSFGLSSLEYLATKIWDIVPYDIKSVGILNLFEEKIRNWKPKGCHYRLCKQYLHGLDMWTFFNIYCF